MTLVKFNKRPFEGGFNNLADGFFNDLPVFFKPEFRGSETKNFNAPVNIKETEKNYQLEVVAPGFEKTDFKVNLDQHLLTISAEKKTETKEDSASNPNDKQIRREYSYRSFKRSFTIDEKIDATNIDASYINGILTLNLPKKETVKVSATEIKIN
jgi:HSP20 family protein